ncbi:hypothetical protein CBR_g19826 [Chara braunii]|uniref:Up-regulated in Daf-2 domain-containing protein n=1 Tax=Chara braunii TaxID=69332 RepID=A0A388JU62_CHABU|nr:hypothetical protein CBR_g19826 [Chara braunii]|eukprot:GBG61293.1 hypothetical protein CBR_g19826 [Chara braunii]
MSGDTSTLFYTDPKNFRSIFDSLESVLPDVVSAVAGAAAGLATAETGPGALIAAGAAAAGSKVICNALFNSEGTTGFKQHILRAEDENALTEIIVHGNMTVTFRSNSGVSETVVSSKRVR